MQVCKYELYTLIYLSMNYRNRSEIYVPFSYSEDKTTEFVCGLLKFNGLQHYENTPTQIYWKFHDQKLKIFR